MEEIREDLKTQSAVIIEKSRETFELLAKVMNEVHGIALSTRFYKLFLEDHVRSAINHIEELNCNEYRSVRPHTRSMNILLSSLSIKARTFIVDIVKRVITVHHSYKRKMVLKEYDNISFGLSHLEPSVDHYKSRELPSYHPFFIGGGENAKRVKVQQLAEKFRDPFKRNVIRLLPKFAIEYFDKLYDDIELIRPESKIFHAQVLRFSVYNSLFVAKYVEHGSKLIWYQEGAECAELECKYSRYYQYSVSDEYRTWGWQMEEKDVPWKAYPLISFRNKYLKCSIEYEYDIMLCFPEIHPTNILFYESVTTYLVSNLEKSKEYKILARPYPVSNRKTNKKELDFIEGSAIDKSSALSPIMQEISKSKLVVQMEIPSTNFLECLVINHPTIGLLRNEQPTPLIKPYYDFLLGKRVLHPDIKSLVDHVNFVNVNDWWQSVINDPIMQEFKSKFAGIAL